MRFCRWPRGLVVLTCIGIWVATRTADLAGQHHPTESLGDSQPLDENLDPQPVVDTPRVLPETGDEPVPISEPEPMIPGDIQQEDVPAVDEPSADAPSGDQPTAADRIYAGQPDGRQPATSGENNDQPTAGQPMIDAAGSPIEAARFNGIQPGTSTIDEVTSAWGEPEKAEQLEQSRQRLEYSMDPFERIVVHAEDGRVTSIIVSLAGRFPAAALAGQLKLDDLSAVIITDDEGNWLGEAYPERGVVFHFTPEAEGRQVSHVMLDPVDAGAFVLRAEGLLESHPQAALSDADVAVELDPNLARAHWLRARILVSIGRPGEAMAAAKTATRLDPQSAEYRLTLAEVLQASGDYAAASSQTNQAILLAGDRAELKARGLLQLGNQMAAGPDRDYRRATEYHLRAIKAAEPLAVDSRPRVRSAVTEVLIEAHLAVANDIAWGHWRQKERAVPMWLSRAAAIVDRSIKNDPVNSRYRLRVVRQALASQVGMGGTSDPAEWVQRLRQVSTRQAEEVEDQYGQSRLQWEIGVALYDAMQTYHLRAEHDKALEYGGAAVTYLEAGAEGREDLPDDAYLMGRLYFRVGSIYAIQYADHAKAIAWFDKAAPLLKHPVPKSALADAGRQGESLVSMAVSYWEASRRDDAVALTDQGVKMMQQAVADGILDRSALLIPYGNLATMHQHLGNHQRARQYVELTGREEPVSR